MTARIFSTKTFKKMTALVLIFSSAACGNKPTTFSLLAENDQFQQAVYGYNNKIDILWIVDGSGTMANHQANLANNFSAFISEFTANEFDFHMAVASTDAWLREVNYNGGTCQSNPNPTNNPNQTYRSSADCANTLATFAQLTHFRDGDIYGAQNGTPAARSGQYLITSAMPTSTVQSLFSTNVRTGTRGDGAREAGFQSIRSVLRRNANGSIGYGGELHTALAAFRRPDAFFKIIIVSDEEDQSLKPNGYAYANLNEYVTSFKTFLDGYSRLEDGTAGRYAVSSITIDNINNCSYGLHEQATQGDRYIAIANATGGVVGSICSANFSHDLQQIAQKVVTLITRFAIAREPVPSSIRVIVNGVAVPENQDNGWTYSSDGGKYYINFHGTGVPPQGATISVDYDPTTIM